VQEPPMGLAAAGMGQQQPPGPAAMSVQEARRANAERYRRAGDYLMSVNRGKDAEVFYKKANELDPTENFLAPVAGLDKQGRPILIQPGNQGGQRTMVDVAPPAPELPADVRALEYVTGQPLAGTGTAGVTQLGEYRRAGAPSQTVKVNTTPEGRALDAYFETIGKELPKLEATAQKAAQTNEQLTRLTKLANSNTFTGWLAPGQVGATQFFKSLGVDIKPEALANTRTFQAAANILVLDFMAAMGGARGFSEKESAILYDAFPKIIDTPQARSAIIQMLKNRNDDIIRDYNTARSSFEEGIGRKLPSPQIRPSATSSDPGVSAPTLRYNLRTGRLEEVRQ